MPYWFRSTPEPTPSTSKWVAEQASAHKNPSDRDERSNTPAHDPSLPLPVTAAKHIPPHRTRSAYSTASHSKKPTVRFGSRWSAFWYDFKKRIGPGTPPSSIGGKSPQEMAFSPPREVEERVGDTTTVVDSVVVDRVWTSDVKASSSTHTSEPDITPEYSGDSAPHKPVLHEAEVHGFFYYMWHFIRWRLWHTASNFFYPTGYSNEETESHYQKEDWFVSKRLALLSSLYLILNWALGVGIAIRPFNRIDIIFYYCVGPIFSIPIPFMIVYNWPQTHRFIYQCFLTFSIWMWAMYYMLYIYLCGFYDVTHQFFSCGNRDFIALFFYTTGLQTIALFGLKLDRFPAAVGALLFFLLSCILIVPDKSTWIRTMVNFVIFHTFLIYVHYKRELASRRTHNLRTKMKLQYRATQRAQISERKMANSKYRLTSYVFHEVRVPLNAAIIAIQNLGASGTVTKEMDIEFAAVEGSLNTMSKVLNDVLDFNRIDGGHFEAVRKPFAFHKAMRTLLNTISVTTNAKGLKLVTLLDDSIDMVARREVYKALGQDEDAIKQHFEDHPTEDGVVVGDETRLRQIVQNLASNACKFTPSGGTVTISTRLISTDTGEGMITQIPVNYEPHQMLSASNLSIHNRNHGESPNSIVVRIEVTDTGCGISPVESRELFSPFHQTEQGREQGGTGSGLGLSLVRSIAKLLGGRLGFSSQKNVGSTFWVELPYAVGEDAIKTKPLTDSESSVLIGPQWPKSEADVDIRTKIRNETNVLLPSSSPAHSTLLEHAGPVELTVRSRPFPNATQAHINPATSTSLESGTEPTVISPSPSPARRPPNVTMPTSQTFAIDPAPTGSTNISSNSSASVPNAMAIFDNAFNASSSQRDLSEESPTGLSVLVVDDDAMTRLMMSRLLTRLGCEIALAENGQIAMQMILGSEWDASTKENNALLRNDSSGRFSPQTFEPGPDATAKSEAGPLPDVLQDKYHLIFMDNQMPIMSGLQAVRLLRRLGRKDFIVGLTGNALLPDQEEYSTAGVDLVLTKPVWERAIKDVLKQADSRRKKAMRWHSKRQNALSDSVDSTDVQATTH